MSSSSDEIVFSKKGRREMSAFVTQELIYDYLNGVLDDERRRAFEAALQQSRDGKNDLSKMRNAIDYTHQLSKTMVAEPVLREIKMPSTYVDVLLRKLRVDNWPMGVKLGLEVIAVAVIVVLIALFIPWSALVRQQISDAELITLAQLEKSQESSVLEREVEQQSGAQFPDETADTPKQAVVAVAPVQVKPVADSPKVAETPPASKPAAREGFIFRGSISIVNLSVSNAKIVEVLNELGARKAGQVALGRIKNNSAYFHMTLPETRLEDLKKTFSQYGELNLVREKHERVMPEGIVRLIIEVTEKKGTP